MSRVLSPVNIEIAVRLYYERISLNNADIKLLFGVSSSATVTKYKKTVVDFFAKDGISPYHRNQTLDTYRAYEAWGLDINDLEKRLRKLKKHNFLQ